MQSRCRRTGDQRSLPAAFHQLTSTHLPDGVQVQRWEALGGKGNFVLHCRKRVSGEKTTEGTSEAKGGTRGWELTGRKAKDSGGKGQRKGSLGLHCGSGLGQWRTEGGQKCRFSTVEKAAVDTWVQLSLGSKLESVETEGKRSPQRVRLVETGRRQWDSRRR